MKWRTAEFLNKFLELIGYLQKLQIMMHAGWNIQSAKNLSRRFRNWWRREKRRFIKGTNGKTMAMPLSRLFEVLFDNPVVVKYPIFWTQKAKNRYVKKTDAVHLPKRRIFSCRTYRYPKWIALIPRRGRWNCRNLSFTAWTYFIISRIISMCLSESLRMKNFLAVFNAEEKSSS